MKYFRTEVGIHNQNSPGGGGGLGGTHHALHLDVIYKPIIWASQMGLTVRTPHDFVVRVRSASDSPG